MNANFQPVIGGWKAKVPFELIAENEQKSIFSVEFPLLIPGWYSLRWSPVLCHVPTWDGSPDIRMMVNYDTEDSIALSGQINTETSHAAYLSETRKLLPLDGSAPSPCGTWSKSFHTTDGGGPFTFTLDLVGAEQLNGVVDGWVHLLLKRED